MTQRLICLNVDRMSVELSLEERLMNLTQRVERLGNR